MLDVQMFSKADLEHHAAREIERAIESDRKIQRYKRKQEFWRSFEWGYVFLALVALALIGVFGVGLALDQQNPDPAPIVRQEQNFRIVDESCFIVDDDTYCAFFERVHN